MSDIATKQSARWRTLKRLLTVAGTAAALVAAPIAGSAPWAASTQQAPRINVEGTLFKVTLANGAELPQAALPGTVLTIGDGTGLQRRIRIDAVEPDPKDRDGETMLYTFSTQDSAGGEWYNACLPDPEGRRMGFPLNGAFTLDMKHVDVPGRFLITCTGGAEGKCIRFGYKPWRTLPDGTSLAPHYQACVRLVRADYLGDGVGYTRNGTLIDLFDHIGIQKDEPADGMELEAAWGPDGAICVRHTRVPEVLTTEALTAHFPGLTSGRCDESTPALLYNRSLVH